MMRSPMMEPYSFLYEVYTLGSNVILPSQYMDLPVV